MAQIELSKNKAIYFIVPEESGTGVRKIADKVAKDVEKTIGFLPQIYETANKINYHSGEENGIQAIIVVTAGKGEMAGKLKQAFPQIAKIEGKRESYAFFVAEKPFEAVDRGLIIYGSDKLGTIYGMFHLSELLGVTSVTEWGDCQYIQKDRVFIEESQNVFSKEPSVEYRGFFINDEWPCFGTWATSHYGGFNAKMYDHIFEYLLRMKGNYLWPAMWASNFMLDGPDMESMKLADEYGIYIGMSHHEPCMRSGAEYSKVRGKKSPYGDDWSYVTNRDGILKFWEDGVKRSVGHNVFVTVGMRGENDSKMLGENSTISENVHLLKEIIVKQKEMIHTYLEQDERKVPKLFAVYKEVEDYYFGGKAEAGLRGFEPLDDVTLLLCEDNFGNMRALPEKFERNHSGGFGMYYHLDYHGSPISFEWVASTELTKIWEQMTQAYEYGVRKLWIVNVGDVKFQEYPLNYFMNLAYDFEKWGSAAKNMTAQYTQNWINSVFGDYTLDTEQADIKEVLDGYLRINSLRRPESLNDTIYHPAHELESDRLLNQCKILEEKNERILNSLREKNMADAYYSMIYFSAAASINLLKMHLYSGKNHLYASQGKAVANIYGDLVEECIQRDEQLTRDMAAFKDGKWSGMELASHIGFTNWNDEDWRYPVRSVVRLPKKARLVVSKSDEVCHYTNQYFPDTLVVSDFVESSCEQVKIQIANGGQGMLKWEIVPGIRKVGADGIAKNARENVLCEWLEFSAHSGETKLQDEVVLSINREKLPLGETVECGFEVCTDTEAVPVIVKAKKADWSKIPDRTFVTGNQIFVMRAKHFAEKTDGVYENQKAAFEILDDFGKYKSGMKVFPVTAAFESKEAAPSLVYQLWSEFEGDYILQLHTSAANPLIYGGKLHMDVLVNGEERAVCFTENGYKGGEPGCKAWEDAVLNQEHSARTELKLKKGLNKIYIFAREAGIVLENLMVYPKAVLPKTSYLGPTESTFIKH